MAQRRLSRKPSPARIEIEERDQANNLVATYIKTSSNEGNGGSRVDVVVSHLETCELFAKN